MKSRLETTVPIVAVRQVASTFAAPAEGFYPRERYCRLHQTSGTAGPAAALARHAGELAAGCSTAGSTIFGIVGLRPGDRLFFPFSFGPFLGFWTAFEAAARLGCLCLPGGGMSSGARLRFLLDNEATVVLCTPTYALHLAEVARARRHRPGRARRCGR